MAGYLIVFEGGAREHIIEAGAVAMNTASDDPEAADCFAMGVAWSMMNRDGGTRADVFRIDEERAFGVVCLPEVAGPWTPILGATT